MSSVFVVSQSSVCVSFLLTTFISLVVINASHTFYNAKTQLTSNDMDNPVKKWYSRTLNITSEPEEKRRIIGDTFMQVNNSSFHNPGEYPCCLPFL